MKKVCAYLSIVMILTLGLSNNVFAQDAAKTESETVSATESVTSTETAAAVEEAAAPAVEEKSFHQGLKTKYIEGGVGWMTPILICLILGLALVIERILYLNLATTNADKLLQKVEENIVAGNVEGAKDVCRNTRGPVASIFFQGLSRLDNGLEDVEKSLTSSPG